MSIFKRADKLLNRHVICLDTACSEGLLFAQVLDHSEHEQLNQDLKKYGVRLLLPKSASNNVNLFPHKYYCTQL